MNYPSAGVQRGQIKLFISALSLAASIGVLAGDGRAAQKGEADSSSQARIMQALLLEVRELRLAVEHLAAVNGRQQVILQQMQLQGERLSHASMELEDVRKQIQDVSTQQGDMSRALENIEARLAQEVDPKRISELQGQQADFKIRTEQLATQESRLRVQEADAENLVKTEQNKWQDLSDQLSTLSQCLEEGCSGVTPSEPKQR